VGLRPILAPQRRQLEGSPGCCYRSLIIPSATVPRNLYRPHTYTLSSATPASSQYNLLTQTSLVNGFLCEPLPHKLGAATRG